MEEAKPSFFADSMLGSLARWLRTLGVDVEYERAIEDSEIIRRAAKEDRIILTRDTLLMKRRGVRAYFVESATVQGQLKEVLARFNIPSREPMLTRCLRCNTPLEEADKEAVKGLVPPYVYDTQRDFSRCPSCGRIYWGGTHRGHMAEDLKRMLG